MIEVQIHDEVGFVETIGKRVFLPRVKETIYSEVKGHNVKIIQVHHDPNRIVLFV